MLCSSLCLVVHINAASRRESASAFIQGCRLFPSRVVQTRAIPTIPTADHTGTGDYGCSFPAPLCFSPLHKHPRFARLFKPATIPLTTPESATSRLLGSATDSRIFCPPRIVIDWPTAQLFLLVSVKGLPLRRGLVSHLVGPPILCRFCDTAPTRSGPKVPCDTAVRFARGFHPVLVHLNMLPRASSQQ